MAEIIRVLVKRSLFGIAATVCSVLTKMAVTKRVSVKRWLFVIASTVCNIVLVANVMTNHQTGELSIIDPMYLNESSLDFQLIHQPDACRGHTLSVIVSSAIGNTERRQIIRQTWASGTRVYFLLGRPESSSSQPAIDEEAASYGDILQGYFIDTYRNLTYKSVMGLAWVKNTCNSSFILKVDDDIYVNVTNIGSFLAQTRPSDIYCQVARRVPVVRSLNSDLHKWLVTRQEYSKNIYPDYCLGSFGILFRRSAVSDLLDRISEVPFFWIEDVYVTGLLRERTRLRLAQIPRSKLVRDFSIFSWRNATSVLLGPTDLSGEQMLHISRLLSSMFYL